MGFPFPPGDLDALRAIVGACVDDEGSLEAEGAKSQEFVSGNYSWEKVWSRWDDLLQEVLRGE